jgi:prepilin-type N-terminal cleavage/methylation domain-containing protein
MPGIEKRLARYPQLYSRVGFVHEFRALPEGETRRLRQARWHPAGIALPGIADESSLAAILRITGGNFRLLDRLLTQIARVLEVNRLTQVTSAVVEAARESLVIGTADLKTSLTICPLIFKGSTSMCKSVRGGFTLIEMSIVLVIIGLIGGGVLVGRDLIKAAALRQLGSQIESYNTAVNTFKGKYDCLPGDCANATNFFGQGAPTPGGCPASDYPSPTGTCNGNGNGQLDYPGIPAADEGMWLWQQLSLAQMLAGSYNTDGNPYDAQSGIANPTLPSGLYRSSGGANAGNLGGGVRVYWNSVPLFAPKMPEHVFVVGAEDQTATNSMPALTPAEAQRYDMKFDDGLPQSGNVQAGAVYGTCFSGTHYIANDSFTFVYNVGGFGCSLFIGASF